MVPSIPMVILQIQIESIQFLQKIESTNFFHLQ